MTDWYRYKVAELKDECKARDIPLNGLKLKQHFIDKLEKHEAQREPANMQQNGPLVADANGTFVEPVHDQSATDPSKPEEHHKQGLEEPEASQQEDGVAAESQPETEARSRAVVIADIPAKEGIVQPEQTNETTEEGKPDTVTSTGGEKESTAIAKAEEVEKTNPTPPLPTAVSVASTPKPTLIPSDTSTSQLSHIPQVEIAEDQRKRKRRSKSPPPDAEEVAIKKARTENGSISVTEQEADAVIPMQSATQEAQGNREGELWSETAVIPPGSEAADPEKLPEVAVAVKEESTTQTRYEDIEETRTNVLVASQSLPDEPHGSAPEPEEAPSLHSPTSSLYMRNFKRPLHIPTLRAHISNIARLDAESDSELIKTFYLDSVRTHAFVTLASTTAASRVRAAMHGSRFPDEPQREPLFIDFIPDEKVSSWIDLETGGGFGGDRSNRRYEVVYNPRMDGTEAILQPVDSSKPRALPTQPRNTVTKPPQSLPNTGVRPDRANLVPREVSHSSLQQRAPRKSAGETGFKALDELFSSTAAKPKLYYKPAASEIVSDRLKIIRALRTGHQDRGRSGDADMKRYSFERYQGREEWVDKGPEFGFGQRGQAILRGDRGRGRGGGYRGGRGDSWIRGRY